tara:strand:- start:5325 stop:5645 length:321 start_codon:yes stop_codon:yes gene_type:complete
MINKQNDTYQYLKPESSSLSKFDFDIPENNSLDIIVDLAHLKAIISPLNDLLFELNEKQISKGCSLVIVAADATAFSNRDALVIVPTLTEAEDYIQMEQIQRDLGF